MKYITPTLETERLILKRGSYTDYVKVYEYDFTRLRDINGEFEFVKNNPDSLRGFETYADEEDNVLDFIVYIKDNMEPIGNIVADRYNEELNSLEISLNLHPTHWRKGYMTEALLKVMNYIYINLGIDNIVYGYAEDNIKSKGLSDKIGFEYYDEHIEHYKRIDSDIRIVNTIMSKEKYLELYKEKNR